jgi:HAD superfamily hydrolase (TIGR01509 family)
MIRAIIFDMDGLMIDSEPFHYEAYRKVFNSFGKEFAEEENSKRYIGISDIDAAKDMVTRFNIPISPENLVRRKQALYKTILQNQVVPQPGLIELLGKLQRYGYKKAIASSSTLDEIEAVINALRINSFIDNSCSVEEVTKGKPSPDIFLLAAEKLGIKPSECLVLEDAPSGIDAAIAAKMMCYAIPSRETRNKDFSKANRILHSLEDVFDYLQLDSNINSITEPEPL